MTAVVVLWCWAALLLTLLEACIAASARHYRQTPDSPVRTPFTVIKPLRGTDPGMEDNFFALLDADHEGALQVIFAVETADDPAFAAARRVRDRFPDRDILLLQTGPSGPRGGKMHNMIQALKFARHPYVVFSDADVRATRGMIVGTSRAFEEGAEAVFGTPYHLPAPGIGGWWYCIGFNHFFSVPGALALRLGLFHSFAGAWMGYSKRVLAALGGLEPLAHAIADDYTLGSKARATRCAVALLPDLVFLSETGTGLRESLERITKWCAMGFHTMPALYLALPVFTPGCAAAAAWVFAARAGHWEWGAAGFAVAASARAGLGLLQDRFVARLKMPWAVYAALAVSDLGLFLFWFGGMRSTLAWRGKRYRLRFGGGAEVVS